MITDCHTHLWRAEHWSEEMVREASLARGRPAEVHIEEATHWQAVAAVDRAIVFGFHSRHLGLVVPNDLVAAYVCRHPEKLAGFACLDPTEPDCLDEMHRAFEVLRLRGLKLAPLYQNYHPMHDRMQPVYAYCEERGIPVLVHQGTTFARRAPLKYAQPVQLEDVALAYPGLRMVIAHLGHPWIDETLVLIRKHPYLYADISALYYRPWQFYNALVSAMEYGVTGKLLFGSDFPFATPADSIAGLRNVNLVTGNSGLPRVPEEVIQGLLERDTFGLLGL
jgi:uncharacterized protein